MRLNTRISRVLRWIVGCCLGSEAIGNGKTSPQMPGGWVRSGALVASVCRDRGPHTPIDCPIQPQSGSIPVVFSLVLGMVLGMVLGN